MKVIKLDAEFFSQNNIIDYSVLLGVHENYDPSVEDNYSEVLVKY